MKTTHLLALALVLPVASLFAQTPPAGSGHPATEPGSTPAFKGLPVTSSPDGESKPAEDPAAKKAKGPTQIDSLEATFDQKKNEAVFLGDPNVPGSVVVTDPEFNVNCDKLTALLKSADKPKPGAETPDPKTAGSSPKPAASPKPSSPAASPAGGTPAPGAKNGGGSGGLRKAIAEANPGNRVKITQDKVQPDGSTQHSTGVGDKATYDTETGDITLTGMPKVQQGANLTEATASNTIIILNRNGRMKAIGPAKTTIIDKGNSGL